MPGESARPVLPASPRPVAARERHTRRFFESARRGTLLLPFCSDCGQAEQPGAQTCSRCWGTELEWRESAGRARLHSYVVFHRSFHSAFEAPYPVCVVELAEGPRLTAEVIGIPVERLRIGMDLDVVYRAVEDGRPPLCFRATVFQGDCVSERPGFRVSGE